MPAERALGVHWDVNTDCFGFKTVNRDKPLIRRGLLSIISSIYDPLGLVTPFILPAKLILQELCRNKIEWDDPMPEDQLRQWTRWLNDLPLLENLKINRRLIAAKFDDQASCQIHYFSDTSLKGYGVAAYLCVASADDGQVHNNLIMAKSCVALIKQVTVPCLELAVATLTVKMDTM